MINLVHNVVSESNSYMEKESEVGSGGQPLSIKDLKPGMEHVTIRGRVLEATPPKVIKTKKGPRTISNAVIGDSTGRVETTLWGDKAGSLKEGQAVEVKDAWTTSFRGKVQLNIGRSSTVNEINDSEVPQPEDIPSEMPEAPEEQGRSQPTGARRGGFRKRRF
ncbi:OB-fold nucleic acid binding domain-containing protein [Thermogladius sp. 4427co]|uniref:OB-fold nucleic acid binding domain-containing protein n=1 Tax=Thermogladius sp. 4427co TaxID=3450718 RepID=UPI003F7B0B03